MEDIKLDNVEETLFVPMRGRVFASKYHKDILYDEKALEIADKLPSKYMDYSKETEYTLLASATRSKNMDMKVQEFLKTNPTGCIINLGAGLETTYHRNYNNQAKWYELDLEEVTTLRNNIIGQNDLDEIITYSMFDYEWIKYVKTNHPGPYMILVSGIFYYFKMNEVLDLLNNLNKLEKVEIVFDCVSSTGIKFTRKYMKDLDKEDALMYFYVDNVNKLVKNIDNAHIISVDDFYRKVNTKNLKLKTVLSMKISDKFHMVKLIHLKLNNNK